MPEAAPFISVVIPHLNQAQALARCLSSLQQQSYPAGAFEVIVVDNGSTPPPAEIVARFPGVTLLEEPTPGPGPARNKGAAAAKGALLAFIDADCMADRAWLQVIAAKLGENAPEDAEKGPILGGKVEIACQDPARPSGIEAYEMVFSFRQQLYIEKMGFSGAGNLAVSAQDFAAVGPFAGIEISEDRDWGRRATGLGYEIRYLPKMIVSHPARQSLAELTAKWDRQISHDYAAHRQSGKGRWSWCMRALLVGLSPLVDSRKFLNTERPLGGLTKARGCLVLFAVRGSRTRRMLQRAFARDSAVDAVQWNTCSRS